MAASGPETAAYWLPLVTAFLGFASGACTEWIRDNRAYKREREARESQRHDQRSEQRNTFQRQTLLELQAGLMKLMQTTQAIHRVDLQNFRKFGKQQGDDPYPSDIDDACMGANAQTAMLSVRVQDDAVRNLTQQLKDELTRATLMPPSKEVAQLAMIAATKGFVTVNKRIGEVLRSLDDADPR
jgi:hypothetical protein